MATRIITAIITVCVTGCASQQWAEQHWAWINQGRSGIKPQYTTGVTVTNYTVNGQNLQVISPAR